MGTSCRATCHAGINPQLPCQRPSQAIFSFLGNLVSPSLFACIVRRINADAFYLPYRVRISGPEGYHPAQAGFRFPDNLQTGLTVMSEIIPFPQTAPFNSPKIEYLSPIQFSVFLLPQVFLAFCPCHRVLVKQKQVAQGRLYLKYWRLELHRLRISAIREL